MSYNDDFIESRYFVDKNKIKIAELFYDEAAENPAKDYDGFGRVVLERLGNVDVKFDFLNQDEAAESIPELGKEVLSKDKDMFYIDMEKCHKKGLAILPFYYADNVHGAGTNTFFFNCSFKDWGNTNAGKHSPMPNGFIYASKKLWQEEWGLKSIEKAEDSLRKCIEDLQEYCRGNVYRLAVSEVVKDGTPYDSARMYVSSSGVLCYCDADERGGFYDKAGSEVRIEGFLEDMGYEPVKLYESLADLKRESGKYLDAR